MKKKDETPPADPKKKLTRAELMKKLAANPQFKPAAKTGRGLIIAGYQPPEA